LYIACASHFSSSALIGCTMLFQVENVITRLNKTFPDDGLLPIYINPHSGAAGYSPVTFGAMGDRY